jgi:hypothetical protein
MNGTCFVPVASVGALYVTVSPSSLAAFWAPWLLALKYGLPRFFGSR